MNVFVDNYRNFVERKIPRPAKLVGWFGLGFVHLYVLRSWAKSGAEKNARAILAKQQLQTSNSIVGTTSSPGSNMAPMTPVTPLNRK